MSWKQDILNKVVAGFRSQDWRVSTRTSVTGDSIECMYRNAKGDACAVGHLIDDETAKKADLQRAVPLDLVCDGHISGVPEDEEGWVFLESLQFVHDQCVREKKPDFLARRLQVFAKRHHLDWPEA